MKREGGEGGFGQPASGSVGHCTKFITQRTTDIGQLTFKPLP
jgi:hypothetical protein